MQNMTLRSRVGADGNLQLNIPTTLPNTELDVLIWLNPTNLSENNESPETFSEWWAKELATVPHYDNDSERDLRFEYLAERYQL
jgi:hypothetical protein